MQSVIIITIIVQESTEKYDITVNEKLRKMKIETNQIDERLIKIKDIQQKNEVESVQKVVEKLIHKENNIISFIWYMEKEKID